MIDGRIIETLKLASRGSLSAKQVFKRLRGLDMPNEEALMLKEGSWGSRGGYPLGIEGLRQAARDALARIPNDQLPYRLQEKTASEERK